MYLLFSIRVGFKYHQQIKAEDGEAEGNLISIKICENCSKGINRKRSPGAFPTPLPLTGTEFSNLPAGVLRD